MSKLLHTKAERIKLLKAFPNNNDGKDGDIVLCSISGRGIYICAKIDGRWFAANKMQDLKKVEKTSINDLKTKKLSIKQLQDAGSDTDKFVVADAEGNLKYRTGAELISDIAMSLNDLSDVTYLSGDLTITSLDKIISEDLEIDSSRDIVLDADGGQVTIKDDSASHFLFDCDNTKLEIYDDTDSADLFRIVVGASGITTIGTVDDGATVGHLTLAPDGDLILDPVSQKTIINATDGLYFDGGTHTYIAESGTDNLRIVVGGVTMLDINEGAIADIVHVRNSHLSVPAAKHLYLDGGGNTYIKETSADKLEIFVGGDEMVTLDEANQRIILEASKLSYHIEGGTEYSAADSAYAGMILGYTCIGLDEPVGLYNLTTSYAVPTDEFSVAFVAPPSGKVEIEIQTGMDVGSSNAGDLYAGLSTANATSGYSQLADFHESELFDGMSRGALRIIRHSWTLTGLTAGTSYQYWAGFKSSSTTGTPHLQWGGNSSGGYPDFIMKATALPNTITT